MGVDGMLEVTLAGKSNSRFGLVESILVWRISVGRPSPRPTRGLGEDSVNDSLSESLMRCCKGLTASERRRYR